MTIDEVFATAENGTLTLEQFKAAAKDAKFADLAEGGYVAKQKYTDEIAAKDNQIKELTTTISDRDKDLAEVKGQLESAGVDATKLTELTESLSALQAKYDTDTKDYEAKLASQAYEYAVKEFAATKVFSSKAAQRDFIREMVNAGLKVGKNGTITGADDFAKEYAEANTDAFVPDKPEDGKGGDNGGNGGNDADDDFPGEAGAGSTGANLPKFAAHTPGEQGGKETGSFGFSFFPGAK